MCLRDTLPEFCPYSRQSHFVFSPNCGSQLIVQFSTKQNYVTKSQIFFQDNKQDLSVRGGQIMITIYSRLGQWQRSWQYLAPMKEEIQWTECQARELNLVVVGDRAIKCQLLRPLVISRRSSIAAGQSSHAIPICHASLLRVQV